MNVEKKVSQLTILFTGCQTSIGIQGLKKNQQFGNIKLILGKIFK